MKRLIALALALCMVLSLAACGSSSSSDDTEDTSSETTTTEDETSEDESESEEEDAEAEDETESEEEETSTDTGEPVYGGSLTLSFSTWTTVFDPAMNETYACSLWLESLWCMDWGLDDPDEYSYTVNSYTLDQADGQIAESWEVADDYSSLTVTIRDDIYFQDLSDVGREDYDIFGARNLTAEDVKYSYDRVTGLGSGFTEDNYIVVTDNDWTERLYMLDSIEVDDTYTLTFYFNTTTESAISEFILADINITGAEWDELTEDEQADWHYACGTGPYILTDYVAENHMTFVRNDNYYDYDERYPENQLPYLDEVNILYYSDTTAALSDFIAGDLDYVNYNIGLSDSEAEQLLSSTDAVAIGYAKGANGLGLKINQEPFDNEDVRQALQLAINLEEVATAYYGYDELTLPGLWDPGLTTWTTVDSWDDDLLAQYSYDPEQAEELLDEAGYTEDSDGIRFSFTVGVDTSTVNLEVYELAKTYLAEIGVEMNIETFSDMSEARQYQMDSESDYQYSFEIGSGVDSGFVYQSYASDGAQSSNFAEDLEFDALLADVRDAVDSESQAEAAQAAELYYAETHYYIALSGMTEKYEYYSSNVGGIDNGELFSAYHYFKTIAARIWNTEGAE